MKTYVVGHKNPDTDSILSAVIFAELLGNGYEAAKQGEPNKEAEYVLSRFGISAPVDLPAGERKLVLVDHNSKEEGPDDLVPEEIVAIYDHHKLGGPVTSDLVDVRIQKVGCTATVAASVFKEKGAEPSRAAASLMVSAIISDTLKLTSPTTTDMDREVVAELAEKYDINIDELATAMFEAKSDISDVSTEELIGKDYKIFNLCGKRVGVGVWETVLPQTVLDRKEEVLELLSKRKVDDALDYIYFAVVDIMNNKSDFFILGDEEKVLAEAVFGGISEGNVLACPGVVSRKKQITPPIEKYLSK